MWSMTSKRCIRTLVHPARVMSVAVSKNNQIVACGCDDNNIVLWSKATGEQLRTLRHHRHWVWSVDFSPDDQILASGSWDHDLCLWDVASGSHLQTLLGHADQVLSVRFSPDGTHIVTGECGNSVRIWECNGMALQQQRPKESRRLFGSLTGDRRIWQPSTGTSTTTSDHHTATVRALSCSPDGSLIATAAWDGTVRIWDAATGTRLKVLTGQRQLITSVAWSRTGKFLVSTGDSDHVAIVWEVRAGKRAKTFQGHTGSVWVALFTDDEQRVVSCSDDGTIRLWTIEGGKSGSTADSEVLYQGSGPVYTMAMSSGSRWILSGTLDFIQPELPQTGGFSVAPSRRPTRVAGLVRGAWEETYGYPTLRLHDIAGHVLWLENHGSTVASLAFSHDCTRALSGSQDGRIFLYDLTALISLNNTASTTSQAGPANVIIHDFDVGDGKPVEHVSFSEDERAIVSDASYTHLERPLWPMHADRFTSPSSGHTYFLLDGWLWRAVPQLRRICWVPPAFRHFRDGATAWRGNMDTCADIVVFGTIHGKLVTLDLSGC
ncbi:hypothetical protein ONZ51_g12527 [Trametes cubensis]|uniref:WD40 repeat-like protein n=1 Tax=Trametes cubensis TaxID=1111947 RepID=A0AAD7X5C7_9APHY|nr:hypothetical protein ONZ51_g12527 [Trametes cubensis]